MGVDAMKRLLMTLVLVSLVANIGCLPSPSDTPAAKKGGHDDHDHGSGPHGGTIGEWGGGKFHTEFTVDHDKKEAVVFILQEDAKKPNPIKAESILLTLKDPAVQIELKAKPMDGETDGVSSRFVGEHEALGKVQEFAGSITAEVDGTPYAGDFKETAEGHGHKH
jgi:hypothetical protein